MMPAVVHIPLLDTQSPYMLKNKALDPSTSAFTTVNGRNSPPSSRTSNHFGMSANQSPPQHHEQRPSENGYHSRSNSDSPSSSSPNSPDSPNKRKCTDYPEETNGAVRGPEAPTHCPLPPIDRPGGLERRWTAEPQSHNGYQEMRGPRPMEPVQGSNPPMATHQAPNGEQNGFKPGNSTEHSRVAMMNLDPKKRKRQFANRTKTGCGTCRRRKKKCDEAKPGCNNCTRGGFLCEGYASKIPWPKNGVTTPLQAKEKMIHDPTVAYSRYSGCNQIHMPHYEPTRSVSQSYSDPRSLNGTGGGRVRPIVAENQQREPSTPSNWNSGWNESPRVSYPEHAASVPSHDHHNTQPQGLPPPHQHDPRVHHHTPQSMSQTANHTPSIADNHHHTPPAARQTPLMVPPTSAPPAHYTSQSRAHKTAKEKMLNGEPFLPSDELLMEERAHCTGALYNFNKIADPNVMISRSERNRNFRRIVQAQWVQMPRHMDQRTAVHTGGHLGGNVNVATPFHCDYGYNIFIAENVTIGAYCRLHDSIKIAIGRDTKIGNSVTIQTIQTPIDTKSLKGVHGTEIAREVHIGKNVYIGDNVLIEAGIRIGDNAIIRAGSVVSTEIAPHAIAVPPQAIVHGSPTL